MRFLCKIFAHKMYSISWTQSEFTILCTRCEKRWESKGVITNE